MRSSSTLLYISLFALLLLATKLAHALPGGGEAMPANKEPAVWIPNEAAIWKCSHKIKPGYSHYKLSGSDWNKTEREIKRAVEDEGIITRWKFKNSTEFNEWKAPVSFESSYNIPWGRQVTQEKSLSLLLGINTHKKNVTSGRKNKGVKCPWVH